MLGPGIIEATNTVAEYIIKNSKDIYPPSMVTEILLAIILDFGRLIMNHYLEKYFEFNLYKKEPTTVCHYN
jgi:hypothetical protein